MGQLMETIQEVGRGQEVMANAANPLIPLAVEYYHPPPQVDPPVHIGAPGGVPHVNLHPLIIEIDDQHDAFSAQGLPLSMTLLV